MHPDSVAFATAHASLLTAIQANQAVVNAVAANPSAANIAAATKALGPANFAQLVKYRVPAQDAGAALPGPAHLPVAAPVPVVGLAECSEAKSPQQWQHWFWVDVAGMVIFIPTIWLIGGPWGARKAKRDAEEHDRAVEEELARILRDDPSPSPA